MNFKRWLGAIFSSVVLFAFLSAAPARSEDNVTIVLVGDSTVADWAETKPARGWGQMLSRHLDPRAKVINLAVNGASTKTFPDTGNWQKALTSGGQYVLIQFGHNDSHAPEKPESTDAGTDFQLNLKRYIREARAAGLQPVLVTPVHRRMFGADGQPSRELAPYAAAMRSVARETNTPIIDLHETSRAWLAQLGEPGSVGITVSDTDRSHFTERGADTVASFVAAGFPSSVPDLARLAKPAAASHP